MRPSSLEPHRPHLTLIAGGPCRCAVCRNERRFVRAQIIVIVALTAAATVAWWATNGWGLP